ncbi:MAG: hypothetical protein Q8K02_02895 [Flavobacterium sp.]|nr:hypothetical protein [Flavobacterium sp.]
MKKELKIKFFQLFVICILFVNCKKNENVNVQFELLNEELFSLGKDSNYIYRKVYMGAKERAIALNILKYKLTNKSNKRLLFIIDSENLLINESFNFEIMDSLKTLKIRSDPFINFTDESVSYLSFKMYQDSLRKANYINLGVKERDLEKYLNYVNHSFVLNPNESKTLQSFITLPIVRELNLMTFTYPLYFRNINEGDRFFLTYKMNFSDYKDALQDWQIEELRNNKIEFFEGTLTSNSVPIKLINLKD